jgi:hypothetical protein
MVNPVSDSIVVLSGSRDGSMHRTVLALDRTRLAPNASRRQSRNNPPAHSKPPSQLIRRSLN